MISSPHPAWALRLMQADSYKALNGVMDDWYVTLKADHNLQSSMGFKSYMEARNWEGARRSIERTYGRSSPEHRQTLETLGAAIRYRGALRLRG
jgi:hypothetical protein